MFLFLLAHRMIVLDEVDQLDSKGQEVLYTLFEWPSLPNSKLLLVGKSLTLIVLQHKVENLEEPDD